jgi:hypothetical protein
MNDIIVLKFEVASNLKTTEETMKVAKDLSGYVEKFNGIKLSNVGVEYVWNKNQKLPR